LQLTVDNGAELTFWFLIEREETALLNDAKFIDTGIISGFDTHNFAALEHQPVQIFAPA
jgi:hypothetical protein